MAIERIHSKKGFTLNGQNIELQIEKIIQDKIHISDATFSLMPSGEYEISPVQNSNLSHKLCLVVLDNGNAVFRSIPKDFKRFMGRVLEENASDSPQLHGHVVSIPDEGTVFLGGFFKIGDDKLRIHEIFVFKPGESPKK